MSFTMYIHVTFVQDHPSAKNPFKWHIFSCPQCVRRHISDQMAEILNSLSQV